MRVIELTKGYVAVISAQDYRKVNRHSWHVHFSRGTKRNPGKPYARTTIKGKKVYLGPFITGAPPPFQVDHKNNQTLDYRRTNLETITHLENQQRRAARRRGL